MKKIILGLLLLFPTIAHADIFGSPNYWTSSSGNIYRNSGNVGIGTDTTPDATFEITHKTGTPPFQVSSTATSNGDIFQTLENGNIGIGSITPGTVLDVNGTIRGTGFANAFVPTNIQVFSTPGTATWTRPIGVNTVYIKVWGAGGGGGSSNSATKGGGGACGGGYSEGITGVTGNVTVTIGTGGTGSSDGVTVGGAGGTSSFAATTTIQATGGAGGASTTGSLGCTTPGVGSNGTINLTGQNGASADLIAPDNGGAGGAAALGGNGGLSVGQSANGQIGSIPGGGGAGATGASNGGNGASGTVIVYY